MLFVKRNVQEIGKSNRKMASMKVVAEDVGGGGVGAEAGGGAAKKSNAGTGGVGVEEVVLPLLFFAHAGLDTSLAGTSKADLKRTWLLQCSAALSTQGTPLPPQARLGLC
jgi:hypothetical protein